MEQIIISVVFFFLGAFLNDTPPGAGTMSVLVGTVAIAVGGILAAFFLFHPAPGMVAAIVSSLLLGDALMYGASFFRS